MPPLMPLAMRYVLWLFGLQILHVAAGMFLGVPNVLATTVILAAIPAMDIGMRAVERATRALSLRDWAMIWGMMMGVFVLLRVIAPLIALTQFQEVETTDGDPTILLTVAGSTAVMLALFLFLGARTAGRKTG